MTHTVEIILTVKGSADQQNVNAKTETLLSLDTTTDFLKYTLLSLKDRRR